MSYGFVMSAVSANAALAAHTAFKEQHEHSAYKLNFPSEFAETLLEQVHHLTSPMPFLPEGHDFKLGGAIGAGQSVSGHSGAAATPAGALGNSAGALRR